MAYSTDSAVAARVPGIATSADGAKGFVQRLVMQTVFGVLESQGRSALLPEAVISTILSQLNVTTNYEPLNCQKVVLSLAEMVMKNDPPSCIIMSNTVTGICTNMNDNMKACMVAPAMMVTITSINNSYSTISGTLSTTNIIMANWSKEMWQSALNRAVRMLASGPYRSNFFSASAAVGGN
ncbi:hypothetical protein KIN20_021367 [Parelaphostrongylus tenuis]|uniref:Uncharacterized protein n=1 Tax=Parelaphostrongylus tenuis TaxID=148309 RepID=A0AAD5N7V2_PARTN|nr:hypothetical protein KIN20_021367 [Parelaphostrongylus tenuis]